MQRRQRQRRTATSSSASLVSLNAFLYFFFFLFSLFVSLLFSNLNIAPSLRFSSSFQVDCILRHVCCAGDVVVDALSLTPSLHHLSFISHVSSSSIRVAVAVAATATEAVKEFLHPTAKGVAAAVAAAADDDDYEQKSEHPHSALIPLLCCRHISSGLSNTYDTL